MIITSEKRDLYCNECRRFCDSRDEEQQMCVDCAYDQDMAAIACGEEPKMEEGSPW